MPNKLSEIQQKLKAPKSQFNAFGKYNYRSCEDILESVKPLLGDLSIMLEDEIILIGDRYYIKATATLRDEIKVIAQASAFAREPLGKKGMDESQVTGTASSYARKYALNGLLAIDDTRDADTQDNTEGGLITPEQLKTLTDLATKKKVDMVKFLVYLKLDTLKKLPANKFNMAKAAIESKK